MGCVDMRQTTRCDRGVCPCRQPLQLVAEHEIGLRTLQLAGHGSVHRRQPLVERVPDDLPGRERDRRDRGDNRT